MLKMSEKWVDGVRAGQVSLVTEWRCGVTLKMVDTKRMFYFCS